MDKQYRDFLKCDVTVREFLTEKLRGMYLAGIETERNRNQLKIIIKTSRPGLIIGRSGEGATKLKAEVEKEIRKLKLTSKQDIRLEVEEVRSPESNAAVVAEMIAESLEKRMTFRRVMKQTIEKVMANRDVKGVKIGLSGRLGGADMSRKEDLKKGRIPLQTFRADIDFARYEARLPYGSIGIKVWIYGGEIFDKK
jgi:small subunit ribosomal protein S3